MPKRYQIYRDFSGGVNTKVNSKFIKENEVVEAQGVMCDERGALRTTKPSSLRGVDDHSATIYPGRGLFSFKSDYSYSDTVNTLSLRESEYICVADKSNSQIDLFGYNDAADQDDHMMQENILDLGSGTAMQAEFYYADGALRVADASFDTNNTVKWFGRIGTDTKKKLLGVELDREWISTSNTLNKPTVGFHTLNLSATCPSASSQTSGATSSSTTALIGKQPVLTSGVANNIGKASDTTSGDGYLDYNLGLHNINITDTSHGLIDEDFKFSSDGSTYHPDHKWIRIINAGSSDDDFSGYNGIYKLLIRIDANNFWVECPYVQDHDPASGTWIVTDDGQQFQEWTSGVSAANSGSRWLVAYDVSNNDVWKITAVADEEQSVLTTSANSVSWDGRSYEIYPFPGDGALLEVFTSGEADGGLFVEDDYEFGQSFIYEGNQESLITKFEGKNLEVRDERLIYAKVHMSGLSNLSENNTYIDKRIIGGRIYMRRVNDDAPWSLLMDIDYRTNYNSGAVGGGTRLTTIDDYDDWETARDADTGGENMGWTDTNFTALKSKQYEIKSLGVETYENLNGYSANEYALTFGESAGYGYKASVVAGQRIFVANASYVDPDSGLARTMGDAIFYTPVGKYDTFPPSYRLNIAGNDGDEFVALEYVNGVLFAFKKNALYLIDVSNPNEASWKLIAKYDGLGVSGPWGITKSSLGIFWVTKSGLYMMVNNQPKNISNQKISYEDWTDFYSAGSSDDRGPGIGWDSSSNKIILSDNVKAPTKMKMFDIDTQSWSNGYPLTVNPYWLIPGGSSTSQSNMLNFIGNEIQDAGDASILPYGGLLIYTDPATGSSNNKDLRKLSFTSTNNSAFILITKDDDFGMPNIFKKIYEIDIEYITDSTSDTIDVMYEKDGNDYPNSGSNVLVEDQALSGSSNKDNVNILKITPSDSIPIKCRSISLRIASAGTTETYLEIISIAIRYRPITTAAVVTETSSS